MPRFLCFLLDTYIQVFNRNTKGRGLFFFFKVLERKKYLYIYIYTHVIKKKKKKKNNLFRFCTEADFFAFAGMGLYFDASSRDGRDPQTRVFAGVIILARVCFAL